MSRGRRACVLFGSALLLGQFAGCGGRPPVFTEEPPVTRIDDERNVAEPDEHEFWRMRHHIHSFGAEQLRQRLDPVPAGPAEDVNRLGKVPDSSWFTNRIEHLSSQELRAGPGGGDSGPEDFRPWTIVGMKSGGRNPGFVFADTRGRRYICKFDKVGAPVIATAAGPVAARLLWALGYFVPDDRAVFFERGDLVIGAAAEADDGFGGRRPVTDADIDGLLAGVPALQADGSYRALASAFLEGKPVGGYAYWGTRKDDLNDTIPHQNRRSLRALRVFGAWLNHVDLKIDNTLDLYVEEEGRRFLRHYLVDFDGCLGGYWAARHEPRIGYAYDLDLGELVTGVPRLGLRDRIWENLGEPEHELVGLYEAELYDPAAWRPNYLNAQVSAARPADEFWAGLVLSQLSDEHIEAAVELARLGESGAERVLERVLIQRRDKTVDWALRQVTPVIDLADPIAEAGHLRLSAMDALVKAGRPSDLRFSAELLNREGRSLGGLTQEATQPGLVVPADRVAGEDYFVVRWLAHDARGRVLPSTEAHYLRAETAWKLVGILRDGQ
jgi:hypothetical protein